PIQGFLLVFPRTSVVIRHAGRAPVIADPTRVMLYNRGQEYTRRAVSSRGDECEWFAFPRELVADALRAHDPGVDDRGDRPFVATHAPADAATYLLQRRVVEHLGRCAEPDRLFVEEAMMRLLDRSAGAPGPARSAASREIAEACRVVVTRDAGARLSLAGVAASVGVSAFHMARAFRRETGMSIHGYVHEVRLRTALERVTEGEDLARIAADGGYASHSHFSERFRRTFRLTPSSLRALLGAPGRLSVPWEPPADACTRSSARASSRSRSASPTTRGASRRSRP
ncbi:MAG TPA: helix-turn-helix transcriptional regulator, partial [Polyangiaceae bacterium]|nr:helix-turn-helix transcriptional regulator [Polyangiaceae bacterium]